MATRPKPKKEAASGAPPASSSVILVWGTDEYLVGSKAKELVRQLCPPADQALGLEIVEGAVDIIDDAVAAINKTIEAITTVGFFGASKVVWLRDVSFFSEAKPGCFADVKAAVARLAEEIKRGLLDNQKLLISAQKVDRRSAFFKTCQACGTVLDFNLPEKGYQAEQQARETLRHLLHDAGLAASGDALDRMVARAGANTRQLVQEVQKLAAYVGDRKDVTAQDVQEIVSTAREAAGWDLADAVGRRDLAGALRLCRQLVFQKEAPVGMLVGLQSRIRELLVFRACLDRRWLHPGQSSVSWSAPDGALEALPANPRAMHPFRAARLAEQAARFSEADLLAHHKLLVETHERMVSSAVPAELLLEFCLIQMLAGGRRATA